MKLNHTHLSSLLRATVNATRDTEVNYRIEIIKAAIKRWEDIRPLDDASKELAQAKADIAELNQRLHERTQAFLARESKPVTATPLTFGGPPAGYTWRNPEGLTPEQVEVNRGWRLYLNGEAVNESCQVFDNGVWADGSLWEISWTYRTQAPLPAPKPTPEEIERMEFSDWWSETGDEHTSHKTALAAWSAAWKAARAK